MKHQLTEKIHQRQAKIGIVGLGYVGLPLLIEFSRAEFTILGFDVDDQKVQSLKKGVSYIKHISSDAIDDVFSNRAKSDATTDFSRIKECDAILICVPTPLSKQRDPDLSYVVTTCETISPYLRRGQLVVLESTTYPGTTAEVMIPTLEAGSSLKSPGDFFTAYSPEREDPNNKEYTTATIPKVVGGIDQDSLDVACALYDTIICRTVPVADCQTAEATKLMENIFRATNIALVNELKIVFQEMNIDVWEVIRAASTKPFGFMPFFPGPGLGGHCIPIDPFYLTWKAREFGLPTKFIELAGEINTSMPDYVVHRTLLALNEHGKAMNGSRILMVGLAYKKNVDDDRESPTYVLWKKILQHGGLVDYYDPYCPEIRPSREHSDLAGTRSINWDDIQRNGYDAAIIATAHDDVDHNLLANFVPLIVDTRGVCRAAPNVYHA